MSWYSDKERFNEYDPDWCVRRNCQKGFSKEECDRCIRLHEQTEEEEEWSWDKWKGADNE